MLVVGLTVGRAWLGLRLSCCKVGLEVGADYVDLLGCCSAQAIRGGAAEWWKVRRCSRPCGYVTQLGNGVVVCSKAERVGV